MRKIWNRPAWPVWSMVTRDLQGISNLNICTYVQIISMQPKQVMVAVYQGTKTLENIQVMPNQKIGLQLLAESLAPTVRILGRQSGFATDKLKKVERKYKVAYEDDLPYFEDACGFMILDTVQLIDVSGDHCLCIGKVVKSKNLSVEKILTTDYLKDKKYIR